MKTGNTIGAVVIGGDFQGLGVIRSLSEREVPVFLVEYEWSIGRYSRYVRGKTRNNGLLLDGSFAGYLIDLCKKENLNGWVLFPNNDETVKLLSIHREELSGFYRNPVPPWETTRKFYIKKNAYEIAENISIPIPRMYRGEKLQEFLDQDLRFPLVLKPSFKENYFPKTKKKAVRVKDRETFIQEYTNMTAIIPPSEVVVQEMVEGGTKNLFSFVCFFDGKESVAGMSAKRLRQHPMDFGQATTYAVSSHMPELGEMATKLLREIGYYGLAEVEFMKDEKDGLFKFLEINGRPWGWHTLAKASGINLPFNLFQHMTGGMVENSPQIEGVKWIRLITDIPTVMKEISAGRMGFLDYITSLKGKREFAVFSTRDPLPFFVEFAMIPYLWWKRGF